MVTDFGAMDFGLVPSWRASEPRPAGIPDDIAARYVCREWRNAVAVLQGAYPEEWEDLVSVLRSFRLCRSALQAGGGNKTEIAKALDVHFSSLGWQETASTRGDRPAPPEDWPRGRVFESRRAPPTRWTASRTTSPSRSSGTIRTRSSTAT